MGQDPRQLLDTKASGFMLKSRPLQCTAGVTMIEMFTVLVVLTVVMAIGAPATVRWLRQSEIRSNAESLRSSLQKACAEAIARNTRIKISIGDKSGGTSWTMGCAMASDRCPAVLHVQRAPSDSRIRWGAANSHGAGNFFVALTAGAALPGEVEFHPLGNAPRVISGNDIARVDVLHAGDAEAGRLVVSIGSAGNIRICDPALPASAVGRCH